jgi:TatD DNase family protein
MELIDSHCHIFLEEFDTDRADTILKAVNLGIKTLILPNINCATLQRLKDSCETFPDTCKALIGLHPTSVNEDYKRELAIIENELKLHTNLYVGIGEIGIDLYWDKSFYKEQVETFIHQLNLAKSYNLPVAIHIRHSFDETFEALSKSGYKSFEGVFHCFSGSIDQAKQAIDLGFKLGIGGTVTFKNSGIDSVVSVIDLHNIILETDSPYLAPTPYRGKRNEPSFLINIAQKIADIKGINIEEIATSTTNTCRTLFRINA